MGKQLPPEPPLADWDSPLMGDEVEEQEIVSVCALPDQACMLGEAFLNGHVEVFQHVGTLRSSQISPLKIENHGSEITHN